VRKLPSWDDTIVLFVSDHGEQEVSAAPKLRNRPAMDGWSRGGRGRPLRV
jgi:arylsulfatase A-like enzyme